MVDIEVYKSFDDYILMVIDSNVDEILWCSCGYTSYFQVMTDITNLMLIDDINQLDIYVSCAPESFDRVDKMFTLHKNKEKIRQELKDSGRLLTLHESLNIEKGEY